MTVISPSFQIDSKLLFNEFLFAELESEVTSIIQKHNLNNHELWIPYGNQSSNYSIIGNQSSTSEGALAEKLTNAVDALLVKKCLELGIDPESEDSPRSFQEALQRFWNIPNGEFSLASKDIEREILNDLVLMVSSKDCKTWKDLINKEEQQLAISLYDNGEGQTPKRLPETILSLLKGNKHKIPFTQGNHNQGGSSSLMHGGEFSYTLIISKRNISITQYSDPEDTTINFWGWTLVRQELRPNESAPVFTYFAPNGEIPKFEEDQLLLLPNILKGNEAKHYLDYDKSCTAGIPYSKPVYSGTFIKMFNYQLKNKGPLVSHFKYEMGKRLYDTGLPFNFVDCRKNKFNNDTIFRGMKKILEDDLKGTNKLIAEGFPDKSHFDIIVENQFTLQNGIKKPVVQRVNVTVYAFNQRDSNKKDEKSIIGDKPIIFTLGQQVQGGLDGRLLSNVGLSSIKSSLLIILEFPNISPAFKKDLFMTDRERVLEKAPKKEIVKNLKTYLENSDKIKQFKALRIKESLQNSLSADSSQLKELMDKWASNNPSIIKGLTDGKLLLSNSSFTSNGEEERNKKPKKNEPRPVPELKEEPTFFKPIVKSVSNIYVKKVFQNSNFKIAFKTDAPEDYFERLQNPGKVLVKFKSVVLASHFVYDMEPGIFSLSFTNDLTKHLGKFTLSIQIHCPYTNFSESFNFTLEIVKPENKKTKKTKQKLGLPEFIEIGLNDGWDDITEETAALLDGERIVINKDNKYLLSHLLNLTEENEINYSKAFYTYSILFGAVSSKATYLNSHSSFTPESNGSVLSLEDTVIQDTKAIARTLFVNENLLLSIRHNM